MEFRRRREITLFPKIFATFQQQCCPLSQSIFAREVSIKSQLRIISSATGQLRADAICSCGILRSADGFVNREQLIGRDERLGAAQDKISGEILLDQEALRATCMPCWLLSSRSIWRCMPRSAAKSGSAVVDFVGCHDLKNVPDEEVQASIRQVATCAR